MTGLLGVPTATVSETASGASVTFKTSLTNGELYLLKAIGGVTVGTDQEDAEFQVGADIWRRRYVGIDIGTQKLRQKKPGGKRGPDHIILCMFITWSEPGLELP